MAGGAAVVGATLGTGALQAASSAAPAPIAYVSRNNRLLRLAISIPPLWCGNSTARALEIE